jgi:hypothetical protein
VRSASLRIQSYSSKRVGVPVVELSVGQEWLSAFISSRMPCGRLPPTPTFSSITLVIAGVSYVAFGPPRIFAVSRSSPCRLMSLKQLGLRYTLCSIHLPEYGAKVVAIRLLTFWIPNPGSADATSDPIIDEGKRESFITGPSSSPLGKRRPVLLPSQLERKGNAFQVNCGRYPL